MHSREQRNKKVEFYPAKPVPFASAVRRGLAVNVAGRRLAAVAAVRCDPVFPRLDSIR
jgi:invasion protein IalB